MSKRLKMGDIVEIPLSENGTGYAQYTHKHKQYGALLRVFQVREKVDDLADIIECAPSIHDVLSTRRSGE